MTTSQDQAAEHERLADRLRRDRPVPRAGFRAELRARLLVAPAGRGAPRRVRILIAAYGGSGAALLLIAALGAAGAGPLAA